MTVTQILPMDSALSLKVWIQSWYAMCYSCRSLHRITSSSHTHSTRWL